MRCAGLGLLVLAAACNCPKSHELASQDATPEATPTPLDFGDVPVGQLKSLPLQLNDVGALQLDLSQITIQQAGVATPAFSILVPFPTSIGAGSNASATIQFAPTQPGEQTATLVISSNSAASAVYQVTLEGNGTEVSLGTQPSSLNFGDVQVGTTATLPLVVTNNGTSASDAITVQSVSGAQAGQFSWTGTPGALAPGQSFTLTVSFSPTQVGSASAMLPYQGCASCVANQLPLLGVGVDGLLTFSPTPVTFNDIPKGSTASAPVKLTNVGTAPVSLLTLAPKGTANGDFTVSQLSATLPTTLAAGAQLTLEVDYAPTSSGGEMDTLIATYQGSGVAAKTATVPLIGNAALTPCSLTVQPATLNFGSPATGTSVQKSVTLSNAGQSVCDVTGIAIAAASDPSFTLGTPAQTSVNVPAGSTATIAVACDVANTNPPTVRKGTLVFQTGDPVQPSATVPLTAFVSNGSPYSAGWPKWHNDNTDEGQTEADTSGNVGTVLWTYNVGSAQAAIGTEQANLVPTYMNSPVVDGLGDVYQFGMNGTFYAIGPTGKTLWTLPGLAPPVTDPHGGTPILAADGSIFVTGGGDSSLVSSTNIAQLYHLSATGQVLFQVGSPTGCRQVPGQTPGTCLGVDGFDVPPSLSNGGMLFGGDDFGQTAAYDINPVNGDFTQAQTTILPFINERTSLAIDASDNSYWCNGGLCFGVSPPAAGFQPLAAWPSGGANLLNYGLVGGWFNSDLAYDQNHTGWLMVSLGTYLAYQGQTQLLAIDPADGSMKWNVLMPSFTLPIPEEGTEPNWVQDSDVGNAAPAIADDGTVYVGNGDGLYAYDGPTGNLKSGFPFLCADVDSAPAIGGDGTIFFGSSDGSFYAIHPDGTLRFKLVAAARVSSSPAIGPDGTVFFTADDGTLYAVK